MARTETTLYSSGSLTASKTEVISAVTNTKRIIRKATFTNTSGGALTVDIYVDPTGLTEVQIVDTKILADQETWSCPDLEGHILEADGTVDITASGAGIDCVISGVNVT